MEKSKCAVVILEDPLENILLYLRDKIPNMAFPNTFSLFGGEVEVGETPDDAIRREIGEELKFTDGTPYQLSNLHFLGVYQRQDINRDEYVYRAPFLDSLETLVIQEGQYMKLFGRHEIENSNNIAPHHKEILLQYFSKKTSPTPFLYRADNSEFFSNLIMIILVLFHSEILLLWLSLSL